MLYKEVQNIKERVFENVRRALNHILVVCDVLTSKLTEIALNK